MEESSQNSEVTSPGWRPLSVHMCLCHGCLHTGKLHLTSLPSSGVSFFSPKRTTTPGHTARPRALPASRRCRAKARRSTCKPFPTIHPECRNQQRSPDFTGGGGCEFRSQWTTCPQAAACRPPTPTRSSAGFRGAPAATLTTLPTHTAPQPSRGPCPGPLQPRCLTECGKNGTVITSFAAQTKPDVWLLCTFHT